MIIYAILGKFYKDCIPKFEQLNEETRQLLIEGISVNSGYNSQVLLPEKCGTQKIQVNFNYQYLIQFSS